MTSSISAYSHCKPSFRSVDRVRDISKVAGSRNADGFADISNVAVYGNGVAFPDLKENSPIERFFEVFSLDCLQRHQLIEIISKTGTKGSALREQGLRFTGTRLAKGCALREERLRFTGMPGRKVALHRNAVGYWLESLDTVAVYGNARQDNTKSIAQVAVYGNGHG